MEKLGQISLNLWVRVFLNQQRCAGVLHKQVQQSVSPNEISKTMCEFVKTWSIGLYLYDFAHSL